MKTDRWRGHVVTCALLAAISASFSYISFRANSWGKWRKSTALTNCLPLPPPIGCAEVYNSREVLIGGDTDFAWLCFLNFLVSTGLTVLCMCLLAGEDKGSLQSDKRSMKKSLFLAFVLSAVVSILTCLIASFRINIIATMQRRQGLFVVGGIIPSYSLSFYLTCFYALLSLCGSYIANQISVSNETSTTKLKLSKTIKQHMARNIMYPDDQRATKMVTFSSMGPEMEEAAAEVCVKAVMKYTLEEDVAEHIKQTFEQRYGPTWHCAVGANFGSAIHHRTNEYIEVAMPQMSMVLFRCNEALNDDYARQTTQSHKS